MASLSSIDEYRAHFYQQWQKLIYGEAEDTSGSSFALASSDTLEPQALQTAPLPRPTPPMGRDFSPAVPRPLPQPDLQESDRPVSRKQRRSKEHADVEVSSERLVLGVPQLPRPQTVSQFERLPVSVTRVVQDVPLSDLPQPVPEPESQIQALPRPVLKPSQSDGEEGQPGLYDPSAVLEASRIMQEAMDSEEESSTDGGSSVGRWSPPSSGSWEEPPKDDELFGRAADALSNFFARIVPEEVLAPVDRFCNKMEFHKNLPAAC